MWIGRDSLGRKIVLYDDYLKLLEISIMFKNHLSGFEIGKIYNQSLRDAIKEIEALEE